MIFFNGHRKKKSVYFFLKKIVGRHFCIGVAPLFLRSSSPLGLTFPAYVEGTLSPLPTVVRAIKPHQKLSRKVHFLTDWVRGEDWKTGRQQDNMMRRHEVRKTETHEVRKTGRQEDMKLGRQDNKMTKRKEDRKT